jgi:hypothetical protein
VNGAQPNSDSPTGTIDGEGSGSSTPQPYGTVLGSYKGVTIFSNGNGKSAEPVGAYGYQYECVEFVNRFYVSGLGHQGYTCGTGNMKGCGNAYQYFDKASALGLLQFANGGLVAPQIDDIMAFEGGPARCGANQNIPCGHVAIIRDVTSNGIVLAQQNYRSTIEEDPNLFVPMTINGGTYTVANVGSLRPQGWLRIKTAAANPAPAPTPSPTAPAPTVSTGVTSAVSATTAILNGSINPNGMSTSFFFEWGTSIGYGNSTQLDSVGAVNSTTSVSASIGNLSPNTLYHYRLVASNSSSGLIRGMDNSFTTMTTSVSGPVITGISPVIPTSSTSNQTITVNGSGFQSNLTVTVFFPNGSGSSTLSGTQIQNVSSSSFQMIATLNGAGTWGIRVNNPDGQQSTTYSFAVSPTTAAPPFISSIAPATPTSSTSNQTVTVTGSGFQSNLTVTVFFPNSGSSTLSGTQIQNIGSSSFQMIATLNGAGTWGIRVNNPDGQQSATYSFSVSNAVTAAPSITSISPATPTSSTSNQTVTVNGSGFQSNLTVTVFFPNSSGSSTLSGTQIQNVGPSSFQMIATLNGAGVWGLRVNNPDGKQSGTLNFTVIAPTPALRIDGGTSSTRQIGQTFVFSGTGFSPGRTVTHTINPAVNGSTTLTPTLTADSTGSISWSFTPACGNPKGTFAITAVDDASTRASNSVSQIVVGSPSCP